MHTVRYPLSQIDEICNKIDVRQHPHRCTLYHQTLIARLRSWPNKTIQMTTKCWAATKRTKRNKTTYDKRHFFSPLQFVGIQSCIESRRMLVRYTAAGGARVAQLHKSSKHKENHAKKRYSAALDVLKLMWHDVTLKMFVHFFRPCHSCHMQNLMMLMFIMFEKEQKKKIPAKQHTKKTCERICIHKFVSSSLWLIYRTSLTHNTAATHLHPFSSSISTITCHIVIRVHVLRRNFRFICCFCCCRSSHSVDTAHVKNATEKHHKMKENEYTNMFCSNGNASPTNSVPSPHTIIIHPIENEWESSRKRMSTSDTQTRNCRAWAPSLWFRSSKNAGRFIYDDRYAVTTSTAAVASHTHTSTFNSINNRRTLAIAT